MKCSINPSRTVNKNSGKKSKTCGVSSAWREMNDNRLGRDETIDKEMTRLNVWMEGSSDMDLVGQVEKEVDRINEERRSFGKRGLRADAVSVIAIVEKPNMDYMKNLSYEQRVEFLNKSHEVMKDLLHEWNPNWKMLASVQHHDEFGGLSAHNHSLVMVSTKDKEGIANMCAFKEYNLKFFNHINKNYPARMRSLGFEVEDVRTFDQLSEQEKLERKLHPEEHGVDAVLYKQRKHEELKQSIKNLEVKNEDLSQALEKKIIEITEAPSLSAYKTVVEENENLKSELALKDKIIEKLKYEIESLKLSIQNWKQKFVDISRQAGSKLMKVFGFETKDENMDVFPQQKIITEFNKMQGLIITENPSKYRVVPDEDTIHFKIVSKENDTYKVVEKGFKTRIEAQNRIKEINRVYKSLLPKQKEELLRKVK
ncbi:plasmid recombination protein [Faecalicoccus acidiformans]|uniref:plasmid recombination protein n=1 Tax=Faecalicoccus acidiformans TaxID=915173 RepID=UPI0025A44860|nr:plasmid recombination protein [Faecalicoccus acidiformans]MDM8202796.1 plasmid recombination protein [Faecalicoccus acidiformans]